jgi:tetratricopeptide (TPR) repeat protein
MRAAFSVTLMLLLGAPAVAAQSSYDEQVRRGDSLSHALEPATALEAYRAAYMADQTYEAMWKFAEAQIDVAKRLQDTKQAKLRDSLYSVAEIYSRAAIHTDSLDAEGHFMLANALGRLSRTRGGRERVRFAKEIYESAARAVALNPAHDGAYHVLGAWHAEVKRLSGIAKFFAKTFFGAGFLDRASWDSAAVNLERAVELRPEYLYHRLELAEIYIDVERYADARRELEALLALPPTSDVSDPQYQSEARTLLSEIRDRP